MNKKILTTEYKMLCLDIDGTLINDDKSISDHTRQEIIRVTTTYGVRLIIASSRMPRSMDILAEELQANQPIIAYNGALILDSVSNESERKILFSASINSEASAKIIDFASQYDLHMGMFRFDEWFVNDRGYWTDREIKNTKLEPTFYDLKAKIHEWKNSSFGPHKIMFRGTPQVLDAVENYLKDSFLHLIYAHRIKDSVLEIAPINISKGSAVQFLCEKLHIKNDYVIAFGDSYNDIDMLKWVGLGIAMENAPDSIKEAANEVTTSNNNDGIAIALKKYFP